MVVARGFVKNVVESGARARFCGERAEKCALYMLKSGLCARINRIARKQTC